MARKIACTKDIIVMKSADASVKVEEVSECSNVSLRVVYKKLSKSVLKSLKRKDQHLDLTYKLSRTLHGFIRQQNQI